MNIDTRSATAQAVPLLKLSQGARERLVCPVCKGPLALSSEGALCTTASCAQFYPIIDGIPVLINERDSIFSLNDFIARGSTTFAPRSKLKEIVGRILPEIHDSARTRVNASRFLALLPQAPRVLVVGGSIVGHGLEELLARQDIEFVETDVAFGPRTALICDGHDLPFAADSFDGAIIQATLEHVLDPERCVDELHRVLKPSALVYAETPFMQQVHMGRYDFTRFTFLGHRRLFRRFAEESSGPVAGPAVALNWSIRYFLLSFVKSRAGVAAVQGVSRALLFWLKYLDRAIMDRPGAYDGASCFYFLGRKSEVILSDRELLSLYRGVL